MQIDKHGERETRTNTLTHTLTEGHTHTQSTKVGSAGVLLTMTKCPRQKLAQVLQEKVSSISVLVCACV